MGNTDLRARAVMGEIFCSEEGDQNSFALEAMGCFSQARQMQTQEFCHNMLLCPLPEYFLLTHVSATLSPSILMMSINGGDGLDPSPILWL